MKITLTMFAVAAWLPVVGSVSAREVRPLATNAPACIELHDQYDSPQRLTFPATNITVLTIADRMGSEQVDGWIAALKPRYAGRIRLRGLADLGGAPAFIHGKIRKKFQAARPYPVMMDWSGKTCALLSYEKDVANILVLGRDGAILGRFSGTACAASLAEAGAVLDKALSDPPPIASNLGITSP